MGKYTSFFGDISVGYIFKLKTDISLRFQLATYNKIFNDAKSISSATSEV